MADYYTEASFSVQFDNAEKANQAWDVFKKFTVAQELEEYGYVGFNCENDIDNSWWISQDESMNVDQVADFLKQLVDRDLISPMGFEYSHTCSKPHLNAFGGGCAFITKKKIYWNNTGTILTKWAKKYGESP